MTGLRSQQLPAGNNVGARGVLQLGGGSKPDLASLSPGFLRGRRMAPVSHSDTAALGMYQLLVIHIGGAAHSDLSASQMLGLHLVGPLEQCGRVVCVLTSCCFVVSGSAKACTAYTAAGETKDAERQGHAKVHATLLTCRCRLRQAAKRLNAEATMWRLGPIWVNRSR
jgi:hypothetical protein